MKSFLFAIAILCALPSQIIASTCPPPPVPLRQLVPNSENILIGRILSLQEITVDNQYQRTQAEFEVHQVLKGKIKSKTISLFMDPWAQQVIDGSTSDEGRMLIFINLSQVDGKLYYPTAYQDSYKMMDEAGLRIYRQRIKELQGINTLKDETRRNQLTVDWLINCASNRYTYWEGVYDLGPSGHFLEYYDYEKEQAITRVELSATQKQKIRAIILKQTRFSYLELGLINTILEGPDPEILGLLVKNLKSTKTEDLYFQQFLMRQIAFMTQRKELLEAMVQLDSIGFVDDYEEKVIVIAKDFLNKI